MYKLSNTAKMPGKSWATPATECNVGSCLYKVKGSVCSKCYARKGMYRFPSAQNLRQENYNRYIEFPETFEPELTTLIQAEYLKTGVAYFRWFDSGDISSYDMLLSIIRIARALTHITFWLPTKEYKVLDKACKYLDSIGETLPNNLTIRLSVYMIDGDYIELPSHMADVQQTRVISKEATPSKDEFVCTLNCVGCGYTCWNQDKKVAYVEH